MSTLPYHPRPPGELAYGLLLIAYGFNLIYYTPYAICHTLACPKDKDLRLRYWLLASVNFRRTHPSSSELLRFLSRMAASKPTSWVSEGEYFLFHLSQILRP